MIIWILQGNDLRKVLVTGMIDAFCELIASLLGGRILCIYLGKL